jgi:hypothetical protein
MKNKKIYINKRPVSGPWGGGNKFVRYLSSYLIEEKYDVTYKLENDVDLIFCFDPRPNSDRIWYQDFLNHREKYDSKIIQRIGDIGTHSKPDLNYLVKESSVLSDFVIFPSMWSKEMINYKKDNYSIIHNAPMKVFFKSKKNKNKEEKIKVITHHWSTNKKKGFDYYSFLGKKIKEGLDNIDFTYIGRYNEDFSKEGIKHIQPLDEVNLSLLLPEYDVYLTASLEEAGANHVLEAIASKLPVAYRKGGGSINEYCKEYGIEYDSKESMIECIKKLKNYKRKKQYNRNIDDVIKSYEEIICTILST